MKITFKVNGESRTVDAEPEMPLLWALRDLLGLKGAKYGCGIGACGACTVQVNGKVRGKIALPADADRSDVESAALDSPVVRRFTEGMAVRKVIVVPGKLVNVVAG